MKAKYDSSKGKRGQFFRPEAQLNLPIYLDTEVRDYLIERAQSKGVNLSELVNDLLRKDIALVEGLKETSEPDFAPGKQAVLDF